MHNPQTDDLRLTQVAGDADCETVARLVSLAFGGEMQGCRDWIKNAGAENLRVMRDRRDDCPPIPSCMLRIPMAAFFGGRSVPLLGIAGVAVGPESRGRGIGLTMMREAMLEAAREGWALSGLYASTQALYRQVGFEQAGDRCEVSLRLPNLGLRDRRAAITPLTDGDAESVKACYNAFARRFDGPLDRGEYIWNRIRAWRDKVYQGFATRNARGEIDGYLYLTQNRKDTGKFDIALSDFAATNADAFGRLLGFLADFAMMADVVTFHGGPHHPALLLLPQQSFTIRHHEFWMLRVLNVKRAFESRGWPAGVTGVAEIQIRDDLVEENSGKFVIRVSDGAAVVERGGTGQITMDIRALAPLFTGLQDLHGLQLAGMIEGSPDAIASGSAVFRRGSPWTGDFY